MKEYVKHLPVAVWRDVCYNYISWMYPWKRHLYKCVAYNLKSGCVLIIQPRLWASIIFYPYDVLLQIARTIRGDKFEWPRNDGLAIYIGKHSDDYKKVFVSQ